MNQKQKTAIQSAIHSAERDIPERAVDEISLLLRDAFPDLAQKLDFENNTHDTITCLAEQAGRERVS